MNTSTRFTRYDLFKFIVAIFLLILYLIMIRQSPAQSVGSTSTLLPTNALATPSILPAATEQLLTTNPTRVAVSRTPLVLTLTPSPIPSLTETNPSEPASTLLPSPTSTSVVESTVTPIAETPLVSACDAADSRARLQVGSNATILRRLNFRSSPGIRDNWLLTNVPGTRVEIIGGPECVPYWTGAYLWWQIQLPDGHVGWSAESSLHGSFYFMEPVQ